MANNALITVRPRGPRPKPRGIPVARTPQQWAERDAPHLAAVRTLAAAGASLREIAEALGGCNVKTAREYLRRNGIVQARKPPDARSVLVLIEPVRWPTGHGVQGYAGCDLEDTGEL